MNANAPSIFILETGAEAEEKEEFINMLIKYAHTGYRVYF